MIYTNVTTHINILGPHQKSPRYWLLAQAIHLHPNRTITSLAPLVVLLVLVLLEPMLDVPELVCHFLFLNPRSVSSILFGHFN